ncbi:MAG: hypothetical protein MJA28_06405 [Gammaproteobacteria bacterium]|nr:hypothetical protein [Gammaproteobacteria bacterium]
MADITHISGENYLQADDLLKQRIGKHKAVMIVTLDEDGRFNTFMSSGFLFVESVYGARLLSFDVEHFSFSGEEND